MLSSFRIFDANPNLPLSQPGIVTLLIDNPCKWFSLSHTTKIDVFQGAVEEWIRFYDFILEIVILESRKSSGSKEDR